MNNTEPSNSDTEQRIKRLELLTKISIVIVCLLIGNMILNKLPRPDWEPKNYICSKKISNNPPKTLNVTFRQEGIFSETCTSGGKKARKGTTTKGDCGIRLAAIIKQGYNCKRTFLDLD